MPSFAGPEGSGLGVLIPRQAYTLCGGQLSSYSVGRTGILLIFGYSVVLREESGTCSKYRRGENRPVRFP